MSAISNRLQEIETAIIAIKVRNDLEPDSVKLGSLPKESYAEYLELLKERDNLLRELSKQVGEMLKK
ncbi:MAG: hypothetical protein GY705_18765 [Bacteroidetes bacterium]|nr:hypothetical protein [Bacteroidota bacterium]